jgi:hypothetical protein
MTKKTPGVQKHTLDELNQLFNEGEAVDHGIFSEMRSNIMLYSGDHYTRKGSRFWERIRDSKEVSDSMKIRLTRNHTQNIMNQYIENILGATPSAKCLPKNNTEIQDQKSAELNDAVLQDGRDKYRIPKKTEDWCSDFTKIGEVHVEMLWDPNIGEFKAFKQAVDENGQPVFNPDGSPAAGAEAVFTGGFKFNRVFGFNIIRDAGAKTLDESPWLAIREMARVEDLKAKLGKDDPRLKKLDEGSDETFLVFDAATASYSRSAKGQCMLRRFYFRPSPRYPKGWFYITTKGAILWDGELPFGVFPLESEICDEVETTPRGRSRIRHIRPYQAEINRKASKMAEHQVTLGDDKVITQHGQKLAQGSMQPGVRSFQANGTVTVIPGRSGEQYLNSMIQDIEELYQIMGVQEDGQEKMTQLDPMAMMWRQIRQKKRYARMGKKFEDFVVRVHQKYLELARNYLPDDAVIYAVGKTEQVNLPEFKNSKPLCYQIKVVPVGEDLESQMGKQLTLNNILQYAGAQLKPEDLGKIIKNMPFANSEEIFSDLTLNYENAKNMMLALDRGEIPEVNQYDDGAYMLQRLVARTRKPDFKYLTPEIQQAYQHQIMTYEELEAEKAMALKQAQAAFIPTGGFLVKCDFYASDPNNPGETHRVSIPSESIGWLLQQLDSQGFTQEQLAMQQKGAQAEIGRRITGAAPTPPPGARPPAPAAAPKPGQTSPGGNLNEDAPPYVPPQPGR